MTERSSHATPGARTTGPAGRLIFTPRGELIEQLVVTFE